MSDSVEPVYEAATTKQGRITVIPNRELALYVRLHELIEMQLDHRGEPYHHLLDYAIPDMSVQQMFGIDPGGFVFIAKTMGQSTQPWNRGLVERARTVDIGTKLIDARLPEGDVLIKMQCYEHVYNGVHDIELVVPKHKYFEWIVGSRDDLHVEHEQEIVGLALRYLCTGEIGDLPITCKYPPPHIPQVR